MKRALVLLVLVGCGKSKANDLPAEAWGTADYAKAGLSIDRPWKVEDFTTAATVLAAQCTDHRDRLPHFHGAKSGAVFAKLVTPPVIESAAPIAEQFKAHAKRSEALNTISKFYLADVIATPSREYIEIMGSYLGEAILLSEEAEPLLATFDRQDPGYQVRRQGLATMTHGFGGMMHGGLLISEDTRVPEDDRLAMLGYVTAALPKLLPTVEPEMQTTIRDNIAKQVEATTGKPHDAFVAAQHALPH